jgi:hypothetical protein
MPSRGSLAGHPMIRHPWPLCITQPAPNVWRIAPAELPPIGHPRTSERRVPINRFIAGLLVDGEWHQRDDVLAAVSDRFPDEASPYLKRVITDLLYRGDLRNEYKRAGERIRLSNRWTR